MEVAIELCKEAGARRAVRLKVCWTISYTTFRRSICQFRKELNNIKFQDMKIPVLTNVTAEFIDDK